ncbi:hypothetical protein TYRP_007587 [Tyrophagus putrescentiae]|nr:hypothetical protein TYRP_007587 [Tyrophagus putrescentiae]
MFVSVFFFFGSFHPPRRISDRIELRDRDFFPFSKFNKDRTEQCTAGKAKSARAKEVTAESGLRDGGGNGGRRKSKLTI